MYSKTTCFVKIGTKRTKNFDYNRGVRQGCILSPILFNLYLNDLPNLLDTTSFTDPIRISNGLKISSLFYADDLVLLSHSRQGLQNSLNALSNFCNKWHMSINEKKSKIMIFTNKKLSKPPTFNINSKPLNQVDDYTYLGVKITASGNFSPHLKQIKDKALHAFFKLSRKINIRNLKPDIASKLFDTFISPILTYSSEIWSLYSKPSFENWDKIDVEKVHLRFCRYYLGVNNKSSNVACRAEMGRFPLKIVIDKLTLKFFNHLISLPNDCIAKQCLILSDTLSKSNKNCYITNLQKLMHNYSPNQTISINQNFTNSFLNELDSSMKTYYFNLWKQLLGNSPKLSFYATFKEYYDEENYLNIINNFDQRKQFTKFRICNHNLAIETGRYSKPKTPRDQRYCLLCNDNKVESEEHMIFECSIYSDFRKHLQSKLTNKIDFSINNSKSLMNSTDDEIIFYLSTFLWKSFSLRQEILSKI